jgi:(p)ppGpp synthase/HD superfamily hydrolase
MATLEQALRVALDAHEGQHDKAGAPYILHPLRMMARMETREAQIIAVLHDVVEDSDVTLDDLRAMGFDEDVVTAVDGLTRRPDETYEAFVQRAGTLPVARLVKLADLEDNMDVRRLGALTDKDLQRLRRYRAAWQALMDMG